MTDITEAIDAWVADRFGSEYDLLQFGFCELMRKTATDATQPIPVTMPDVNGNRTQVSLNDKFDIITWTRWDRTVTFSDNEDFSFGKSEARSAIIPLRFVFAHKNEFGEDLVFEFLNAFPSKFSINGYRYVFTNPDLSIDPDHETIYQTELGATVYEKHRFPWNLCVITINVEFMKCPDGSAADFITDEFGNCLFA